MVQEISSFGGENIWFRVGCVAAVTTILWTSHRSVNVKSLSLLTVFLCLMPGRVSGTAEIQKIFALL